MKISLIATLLNEEKNISVFLDSLLIQTVKPDDVVIVDGGSTDKTVSLIKSFAKKQLPFNFLLCEKKGNRSVGRNEAIRKAKGNIILISDLGCILDRDWVKEIIKPFSDKKVDVVAGYYDAKTKNVFEKCLVPFVLVMPDRVDKKEFLPATRSMGIRKDVWEDIGGFEEKYSHNEDYAFALELKKANKKIVFARKAIVQWIPRSNVAEAFTMFKRFAYGDMEASILRPKVVAIFVRYILALILILLALSTNQRSLWLVLVIGIALYIIWSIKKNYKYIKNWRALYYLPLLQFTADFAVLQGSLNGIISRVLTIRHK